MMKHSSTPKPFGGAEGRFRVLAKDKGSAIYAMDNTDGEKINYTSTQLANTNALLLGDTFQGINNGTIIGHSRRKATRAKAQYYQVLGVSGREGGLRYLLQPLPLGGRSGPFTTFVSDSPKYNLYDILDLNSMVAKPPSTELLETITGIHRALTKQ